MKIKNYLVSLAIVSFLIGCGGGGSDSSNTQSTNGDKIDFLEYMFPTVSTNKSYISQAKFKSTGNLAWGNSTEYIKISEDRVKYLEGVDSSYSHSFFELSEDTIYSYYPSLSYYYQVYGLTVNRFVEVGDTIWIKEPSNNDSQTITCKFQSKLESFKHKYLTFTGDIGDELVNNVELSEQEKELYVGDILKVKCSNDVNPKQDITYYYFQKGVGKVATTQHNCYDEDNKIDLNSEECYKTDYAYSFYVNDSYTQAIKEVVTSQNFDDVVFDYKTGLMWQDDQFSATTMKTWLIWDNAKKCYAGNTENCFQTLGDTASNYCESISLSGYVDWRLPTIDELEGLVDINRDKEPFIKSDFHNVALNNYWSSNTRENDSQIALVKQFDGRDSTGNNQIGMLKGTSAYVRCVRYQGDFTGLVQTRETIEEVEENATEVQDYFIRDNIHEIVKDTKNGWIWQDTKEARLNQKQWLTDENFDICYSDTNALACNDTSGDTAATYCSNLILAGHSDWRLPTKEELLNQVTFKNKNIFKNRNNDYWSSSTAEFKASAHDVSPFVTDGKGLSLKKEKKYIRCIKDE